MSDEELEPRVRSLEGRMNLQEGLRASQDRDLSTVEQRTRAIQRLLQALQPMASTVNSHTLRLERIERTLYNTNEVLAQLAIDTATGFAQVQERFDRIEAEYGAALEQHTETLYQQTGVLNQHTETMSTHTGLLNQHTETMSMHTDLLTEILVKVEQIGPRGD